MEVDQEGVDEYCSSDDEEPEPQPKHRTPERQRTKADTPDSRKIYPPVKDRVAAWPPKPVVTRETPFGDESPIPKLHEPESDSEQPWQTLHLSETTTWKMPAGFVEPESEPECTFLTTIE